MTEQELIEAFRTKKTLFAIFWGQIFEVKITEVESILIDDTLESRVSYINKIIVHVMRPVSAKGLRISSDKLFATEQNLREFYNL